MDTQESGAGVDGLVLLALSQAVADSLPRKRRGRLVARLRAIADDWDREEKVVPIMRPAAGDPALRAAALRLRRTAKLLDWSPFED